MGESPNQTDSLGQPAASRLIAGAVVFFGGFLAPALIPVVASTNWDANVKIALSGLLAFGIPELGMLLAIGILGKAGYLFLKQHVIATLSEYLFPEQVGPMRHRVGVIMFALPLLFGWAQPYSTHLFPHVEMQSLAFAITGDVIFIASFFVLGGDFWERLGKLLVRNSGAAARDE